MIETTHESNLRVLIIDDDAVDRTLICQLIQHDYAVIEAPTADLGLEYAQKFKPACILLDYRLPDALEFEMLQRLVEDGFPVVMLTGQGNEQIAVEALKRGAEDYLAKSNLDTIGLGKTINSAIEKSSMRAELDRRQSEFEEMIAMTGARFRSPLFEISRNALSLLEYLEANDLEKTRASAVQVQASASELTRFTTHLIDFARSASGQMEWQRVDVQDVIHDICSVLGAQYPEVEFTIESLPVVDGDRTLLAKMFKNVLENSIRYRSDDAPPRIRVASRIDRDRWIISLIDNGVGIEPSRLKEVLDPLRKAPSDQGHGFGLPTSAKIAQRHRGRLWVESTGSDGTSVQVALPALPYLNYLKT